MGPKSAETPQTACCDCGMDRIGVLAPDKGPSRQVGRGDKLQLTEQRCYHCLEKFRNGLSALTTVVCHFCACDVLSLTVASGYSVSIIVEVKHAAEY